MQYVDFVFAMSDGGILSKGSPEEVVNDSKVLESYLGS
jgi:ABC-type branched-subunit amino acid transport system ATPase component